jgi:hypothetical protein
MFISLTSARANVCGDLNPYPPNTAFAIRLDDILSVGAATIYDAEGRWGYERNNGSRLVVRNHQTHRSTVLHCVESSADIAALIQKAQAA